MDITDNKYSQFNLIPSAGSSYSKLESNVSPMKQFADSMIASKPSYLIPVTPEEIDFSQYESLNVENVFNPTSRQRELADEVAYSLYAEGNFTDNSERAEAVDSIYKIYKGQYNKNFIADNLPMFISRATGLDNGGVLTESGIKGFNEHNANVWKSTWASFSSSMQTSLMYAKYFATGKLGTQEFQDALDAYDKRTKANGSAYRKDVFDGIYSSFPDRVISGTVEQSPQWLPMLALTAVGLGLDLGATALAGTATASKLATATGISTQSALSAFTKGIGTASKFTQASLMGLSEMGSTAIEMRESGFSPEVTFLSSVLIAVLTTYIEFKGEEIIFKPYDDFIDSLTQPQKETFAVTLNKLVKDSLGNFTKGYGEQVMEEGVESFGGNIIKLAGVALEMALGTGAKPRIGNYEFDEWADLATEALADEIMSQAFSSSKEAIPSSFGMTAVGTLFGFGTNFVAGDYRKTHKANTYFNTNENNKVIKNNYIVVPNVDGAEKVNLDDVAKAKVEPLEVTKVGGAYFASSDSSAEQVKVTQQRGYSAVNEKNISFEESHPELVDEVAKLSDKKNMDGSNQQETSNNVALSDAIVTEEGAEIILRNAFADGKLESYSYMDKDGKMSQANDGSATRLVVTRNGVDVAFVIPIINSNEGTLKDKVSTVAQNVKSVNEQGGLEDRNALIDATSIQNARIILSDVFGIDEIARINTNGEKSSFDSEAKAEKKAKAEENKKKKEEKKKAKDEARKARKAEEKIEASPVDDIKENEEKAKADEENRLKQEAKDRADAEAFLNGIEYGDDDNAPSIDSEKDENASALYGIGKKISGTQFKKNIVDNGKEQYGAVRYVDGDFNKVDKANAVYAVIESSKDPKDGVLVKLSKTYSADAIEKLLTQSSTKTKVEVQNSIDESVNTAEQLAGAEPDEKTVQTNGEKKESDAEKKKSDADKNAEEKSDKKTESNVDEKSDENASNDANADGTKEQITVSEAEELKKKVSDSLAQEGDEKSTEHATNATIIALSQSEEKPDVDTIKKIAEKKPEITPSTTPTAHIENVVDIMMTDKYVAENLKKYNKGNEIDSETKRKISEKLIKYVTEGKFDNKSDKKNILPMLSTARILRIANREKLGLTEEQIANFDNFFGQVKAKLDEKEKSENTDDVLKSSTPKKEKAEQLADKASENNKKANKPAKKSNVKLDTYDIKMLRNMDGLTEEQLKKYGFNDKADYESVLAKAEERQKKAIVQTAEKTLSKKVSDAQASIDAIKNSRTKVSDKTKSVAEQKLIDAKAEMNDYMVGKKTAEDIIKANEEYIKKNKLAVKHLIGFEQIKNAKTNNLVDAIVDNAKKTDGKTIDAGFMANITMNLEGANSEEKMQTFNVWADSMAKKAINELRDEIKNGLQSEDILKELTSDSNLMEIQFMLTSAENKTIENAKKGNTNISSEMSDAFVQLAKIAILTNPKYSKLFAGDFDIMSNSINNQLRNMVNSIIRTEGNNSWANVFDTIDKPKPVVRAQFASIRYAQNASDKTFYDELQTARRMEKEGVDSEKIFEETKWERDANGDWKRWIPTNLSDVDTGMLLAENNCTLGDILHDETLYDGYGFLRNLHVRFEHLSSEDNSSYYRHDDNTGNSVIVINTNDAKKSYGNKFNTDNEIVNAYMTALMHEVQHAIQDYEGTSQGLLIGRKGAIRSLSENYSIAIRHSRKHVNYTIPVGVAEANLENLGFNLKKLHDAYLGEHEAITTANNYNEKELRVNKDNVNGNTYISGTYRKAVYADVYPESVNIDNMKFVRKAKMKLEDGSVVTRFEFDKKALVNEIKTASDNNITEKGAELVAEVLSNYSYSIQDSIIRKYIEGVYLQEGKNFGTYENNRQYHIFDALTDSFGIEREGKELKGLSIVNSAKMLLSDKADISTVLHESLHIVLWSNAEYRKKLLGNMAEAMKSEYDEMEKYIKKNFSIFEDQFNDVNEVLDALDKTISEDFMFEDNVDTEEAIARLYEAWCYNPNEKMNSKVKKVFSALFEFFKRIYGTVTGNEYLPSILNDSFNMLFDDAEGFGYSQNEIEAYNLGGIQIERAQTVRDSIKKDPLNLADYFFSKMYDVEYTSRRTGKQGRAEDKTLTKIIKDTQKELKNRFATSEDIDALVKKIEDAGLFKDTIDALSGDENKKSLIKRAVAEKIIYASESYSAVAHDFKTKLDGLKELLNENPEANIDDVRKDARFKAFEEMFYGKKGIISQIRLKDSQSSHSRFADRFLVTMVNTFENARKKTNSKLESNEFIQVKDFLGGIRKIEGSHKDGKYKEINSLRSLVNFADLMVDEKGLPVTWVYDGSKTQQFRVLGNIYSGILIDLLNYAHTDFLDDGEHSQLGQTSFMATNDNYIKVSSQLLYNSKVNVIDAKDGKMELSTYMLNNKLNVLLDEIENRINDGTLEGIPLSSMNGELIEYARERLKERQNKSADIIDSVLNSVTSLDVASGEDVSNMMDSFDKIINALNELNALEAKEQQAKIRELASQLEKANKATEKVQTKLENTVKRNEKTIKKINDNHEASIVKKDEKIEEQSKKIQALTKNINSVPTNAKTLEKNINRIIDMMGDDKEKNAELISSAIKPFMEQYSSMKNEYDALRKDNKKMMQELLDYENELMNEYKLVATEKGLRLESDIARDFSEVYEKLHNVADDTSNGYVARAVRTFLNTFAKNSTEDTIRTGNVIDTFYKDFEKAFWTGTEASLERLENAKELFKFAVTNGMVKTDANGKIELNNDGSFTVTKSYKELDIVQISELNDIINKIASDAKNELDEYRTAQENEAVELRKSILNSLKDKHKNGINDGITLSNFGKDVRPSSKNEKLFKATNAFYNLASDFELASVKLREIDQEALYTLFFGGVIDDEEGGKKLFTKDFNTLIEMETKNILDRNEKFYEKLSEVFNNPEYKDIIASKFNGNWIQKNILKLDTPENGFDTKNVGTYMYRLLEDEDVKLGSISLDDMNELFREKFGVDLITAEQTDSTKDVLVGMIDNNVPKQFVAIAEFLAEVNAIVKNAEKDIEAIDDKLARFDSAKENGITLTDDDEKAIAKLVDEKKKLTARMNEYKLAGTNDKVNTDSYAMKDIMGIYLMAQQKDGFYKLLSAPKVTVDEDYTVSLNWSKTITNNLSYGNILYVLYNMLYNEEFQPYREIADFMQEDISSRFEEIDRLNYILTGKAMEKADAYFHFMSQNEYDNVSIFGRNVDLKSYEEGLKTSVGKGFTFEREENAKYQLNLDAVTNYMRSVDNQEHFLALAEKIKYMNLILGTNGSEINNAMRLSLGDEDGNATFRMMTDLVSNIASMPTINTVAHSTLGTINWLRSNGAIAKLCGSVTSGLKQYSALELIRDDVGNDNFRKYRNEFIQLLIHELRNGNDIDDVMEKYVYRYSSQMKDRQMSDFYAYRALERYFGIKNANWKEFKDKMNDSILFGTKFLRFSDNIVANATWYVYFNTFYNNDFLGMKEELDESEYITLCANEATQKTLDISPSQGAKNNPEILLSNDSKLKELLLFKAQSLKIANKMYGSVLGKEMNKRTLGDVAKTFAVIGFASAITAGIGGYWASASDEDDDGSIFDDIIKKVGISTGLELLSGLIPIGGDALKDYFLGYKYSNDGLLSDINNIKKNITSKKKTNKKKRIANSVVRFATDLGQYSGLGTSSANKVARMVTNGMNPLYLVNSWYANLFKGFY